MTDSYATVLELEARVSDTFEVPADAARLIARASELIDMATMGRAQAAWDLDPEDADLKTALSDATCDQVEFWLEVGEEHDIAGIRGSLQGGRVQIQKMPGVLGQRALRTLLRAGLYWAGAGVT